MFQLVLLIVVIVLFGWFLVRPKTTKLSEYKSQRDDLKATQQKQASDIKTVHDLVAKMQSSAGDVALLDETLPIESRVTRLQVLLSSIAQNSGMTLVNVSVDPGASGIAAGDKANLDKPFSKPKKLYTSDALINVTGSFDQLKALLSGVENNRRILDVDGMDISAGTDSLLTVHLKLKTYYYAPSPTSLTDTAK